MLNARVQEKINQQLSSRFQLAYVCVDRSMIIRDASSNLMEYGFEGIDLGSDVTELIDFMVGIDANTELNLPMLSSPSGIPITVNLLPDGEMLMVVISNATSQASQRQQLQQAANENALLVDKQKKLMRKLEATSNELEQKNQQLKEASRLQTSFLSGVSHEFRTPLTSIIGYTSLVQDDLRRNLGEIGEQESNSDYLGAVQRSSKHLLSLVENLLDHGKLDSNEIVVRPRVTKLAEIFADVELLMRPLADTKAIGFSVDTDFSDGMQVVVDDSRVRQCLINLVGNAIKFTDEGSVVVDAIWRDDNLQVTITDSGPGISQSDLEKITLPFWQGEDTGKAGTGLGLTITDKIIELMGGDLAISSEVEVGTTAVFDLPVIEVEGAPAAQAEAESTITKPLRILLAEDDIDIASLVTMMLLERGVDVTHVDNGALALEALDKASGSPDEKSYDLVLMDINMPVMSGYEAIEHIRGAGNKIPVLVMSASAMDNDQERAQSLGCDGYLIKPVEIDDLLSLAQQVTG